jgi:hypothetical protein
MHAHLDTERHLDELASASTAQRVGDDTNQRPFTFTSIREGLYAESTGIYTGFFDLRDANSGNEIAIPHDGTGPGVSWVKRDELGEGTARLIASYASNPRSFKYINGKVLLTGPKVWSLAETVDILAEVSGKNDLKIKEVSVQEYARMPRVLTRFGEEEKATTWATAWDAIKHGETAVVTKDLEDILGRKPTSFPEVLGLTQQ